MTRSWHDFNDAEAQIFDLISKGTIARVRLTIARAATTTSSRDGPAANAGGNFSDFTTPDALAPGAEYFVPNWPDTPAGRHWFEVTQGRDVTTGRHDRESVFAWEAKVYRLVPGDNL